MSKQWYQVSSVSREPTLLEVMAEQLRERMHIEEDFVWVEMAEAHPQAEPNESFLLRGNTEDQTSSAINSHSISNVVQPNIDCEGEFSDQSDCSSDSQEDEDIQEDEYVNQCIKSKVKPFTHLKIKYPKPYMLKIRERGVYNNEKRQISSEQNDKKLNEQKNLLPKMKFDAATSAILEMTINNRYLGQFNELIYTGRNSVVIHAYCSRKNCITMPFENAVKIYKTSKNEENNKIIYKQVQREFEHLHMLQQCKTFTLHSYHLPRVVRAWKNVIVMAFIGCHGTVSLTIEDVPPEKDHEVYNSIINFMDKCYNIANLVHGKLSTKKILYWGSNLYFLGWTHSVKTNHPKAFNKLMKDCHFVTEFYKGRGIAVKSAIDLFKQISGQESIDNKLLEHDLYKKYERNPNRRLRPITGPTAHKRFK